MVIVGGGIAGLTCVLTLADQRMPSTVYEASGRVVGWLFSNTGGYWDEGQFSAWGGECIDIDHTTMRRLARRFELDLVNVLKA